VGIETNFSIAQPNFHHCFFRFLAVLCLPFRLGSTLKSLKIFGPPGTGKTHTLLEYVDDELQYIKPDKLGFVTFTRAARAEVLSRTDLTEEQLPWVKTLHALCYKQLNIERSQLVTKQDIVQFGRAIGVHLTGFMPDPIFLDVVQERYQQPTKADRLLQLNHYGRHRGLKLKETLRDAPKELDFKYAKWFTQSYREWKIATGKYDYTDLLTVFLDKGRSPSLDVLVVDEAQDLSWLQWAVVRKLAENCARLYLAGDDDQAIFTWAGASSSMFLLEPADEVQVLPQSFRIPRVVHDLSQRIIQRVRVRHPKEFLPRDVDGEYSPVGRLGNSHLNGDSTLVLYRNFHRGTVLSVQLEDLGVPFGGVNSVLWDPEVRSALAGWQAVQERRNLTTAQARSAVTFCVSKLLREDGLKERLAPTTGELAPGAIFVENLVGAPISRVMSKLPRLAYISRALATHGIERLLDPKITLLSIHQSKGRQADTVVLDLEMARKTYEAYMLDSDDEHRVQYVAVTRAKERLLTLMATDSMCYQL
jgi:DNA helicase-2/ATP-dependent DNA helicase PcrA